MTIQCIFELSYLRNHDQMDVFITSIIPIYLVANATTNHYLVHLNMCSLNFIEKLTWLHECAYDNVCFCLFFLLTVLMNIINTM